MRRPRLLEFDLGRLLGVPMSDTGLYIACGGAAAAAAVLLGQSLLARQQQRPGGGARTLAEHIKLGDGEISHVREDDDASIDSDFARGVESERDARLDQSDAETKALRSEVQNISTRLDRKLDGMKGLLDTVE